MKTIILSCFAWAALITLSMAAECSVGYEPLTPAFLAQAEDVERMDLSGADKVMAANKSSEFQSGQKALQDEFRDKSAELALLLSEDSPDRSKADVLVARLVDVMKELGDLRVTYAVGMVDLFKAGNARKVRTRPPHRDARCDGAITVPVMRRTLTDQEKVIIGVTEDEEKYLKDFQRREAYFRTEQQELRSRLDRALRAKEIDQAMTHSLLEELAASVRQQATNRLDRYFYAEQVLFSPDRMAKLDAFHEKHKKRVKPLKLAK